LTGAEWNWEAVYKKYIEDVKGGKASAHLVRGGFKDGFIKMSAYGPAVSDEAKGKADEAKAKLTAGTLTIFKGPLKDNAGKELLATGTEQGQTDIALEKMDYLVEGVKGSTK
jgi:simple sugar transport system substrate-binding protein